MRTDSRDDEPENSDCMIFEERPRDTQQQILRSAVSGARRRRGRSTWCLGRGTNMNVGTYRGVDVKFRDVWAENIEEEFAVIRRILEDYPYIGMVRAALSTTVKRITLSTQDTEFPGVVARPIGQFDGNTDYHYQTLRCNCDLLKIIQLGITFTDGEGTPCPECCTWQFNFKFSLS